MKIFLDTNLLIALIEKTNINLPIEHEYYTFEKCIYEFKSGIKRKFVSPDFILDNLKAHKSQKNILDKNDATNRIAKYIMQNVLQTLQYNENELINLRNAIKRYNLYYEFGIAEEYEYVEIERDSDIGLMKNFFKQVKLYLRNYSYDIESDISSNKINVILFDQVFGNSYEILNFREILDTCFINPKDLEIVYTALSFYCKIFLTSDKPLVKECLSLGLNHCTNFVYINPENIESEILNILSEYK
ncbi:MAG: hypothetical protein JNN12_06950 [Bacteroidetes Order II. Incertae sedis bacterium]|nr:hypothetical protein [Bacteroidetes Order II. bacterium]